MYKYEITLDDKSVIIATSGYSSIMSIRDILENKLDFINIGDTVVRKADILSIREVETDE